MQGIDLTRPASLVSSIHAPWRATVAECLSRWIKFDAETQARSYLVLEGDKPGARQTIGGSGIATLAGLAR